MPELPDILLYVHCLEPRVLGQHMVVGAHAAELREACYVASSEGLECVGRELGPLLQLGRELQGVARGSAHGVWAELLGGELREEESAEGAESVQEAPARA